MQAWRIAKRAYALDRQGTGARQSGGRWNSPGVAAVHAGLTPEIAAMEKLVHTGDILPQDLVLAVIGWVSRILYLTHVMPPLKELTELMLAPYGSGKIAAAVQAFSSNPVNK